MSEAKKEKKEMVKIKFAKPFKNRNITSEKLSAAKKEYSDEMKAIHGRDQSLPSEPFLIASKVIEKFGEPMIFEVGQIYEVSAEDAQFYTSLYEEKVTHEFGPQVFDDRAKMEMFKKKFHLASLVA